jgi:hypothetical protein
MLEQPGFVLVRAPLVLGERGFRWLDRLLTRAHDRALALAAESSARGVCHGVAQRAPRGADDTAVSDRRAMLQVGARGRR